MSFSKRQPNALTRTYHNISTALLAAVARLDKSLSPSLTLSRLRQHTFTFSDLTYFLHLANAFLWITLMQVPGFPTKLLIPILYTILLLVPLTSQFFTPFIPIASWLLMFYSNRFFPASLRPTVLVSLLPTLESALYGANISSLLTHYTNPVLDILAWLPYGVIHFTFPFVLSLLLFLFRTKPVLHLWARTFGYMNLVGVIIQLLIPTSPPWYEVIHGLTPASYNMLGSPGGLMRIDKLFHTQGYIQGFTHSPLPFGAFPSLHAGNASLCALFVTQFFPSPINTRAIWGYCLVLYWSTMYLTHHYLIDVVGGACLATAFFYFFLPDELRGPQSLAYPPNLSLPFPDPRSVQATSLVSSSGGRGVPNPNKYALYDLPEPSSGFGFGSHARTGSQSANAFLPSRGGGHSRRDSAFDASSEPSSEDEDVDIASGNYQYRSPLPSASVQGQGFPPTPTQASASASVAAKSNGHRHTASIASLTRAGDSSRLETRSPGVGGAGGFKFPPV